MKKDFKDYEELAVSYNTVRETNKGIVFDTKTFFNKIAFLKINVNYTSLWVKYGLAIRESRGQYKFPDEPVLWSKIKYAYEEMHKMQIDCKNRHKNHVETNKDVEETNLSDLLKTWNISLDAVAKYLVDTGNYRISKRVEEWNAIL